MNRRIEMIGLTRFAAAESSNIMKALHLWARSRSVPRVVGILVFARLAQEFRNMLAPLHR